MVNIVRSLIYLCLLPVAGLAQQTTSLDLASANDLSAKNYPVIKQKELVQQTASFSIANLQKGFLPQFNLSGQASYQSETTKVPIVLPGFSIESPSKDQYKLVADVSQLIYDGGTTRQQKNLQTLNANVEEQKVEVELNKIKERVNQLFLSILFLEAQLKQVDIVKADLQSGIQKIEAQVNNGVAFKSSLNMLRAEWLKADQRAIEIRNSRKGLLDVLSLFVGKSLPDDIQLQRPAITPISFNAEIQRPELKLYNQQSMLIGQQDRLITSRNLPKASLFGQAGYGRPGLNFLKNEFDFYYIAGIRLNWSLGGLYTAKKERQIVEVNKRMVEVQRETFLLNTNMLLKQEAAEVVKLQELVKSDQEIISLRQSVKQAAKAQLDNGVITANDYLKEVNAEDQARQSLNAHEIQLLQAQINYQTISGKL